MMRTIQALTGTFLCIAAPALAAGPATQPAARSQAQQLTQSPSQYVVRVGGTMDGLNSRGPVGYRVFDQAFEPNVEVSIANQGQHLVRNPRLRIDGRGGWRNLDELAREVFADTTSESERARAAYEFQRSRRFHCSTYDGEVRDVVKMLNCYGYTLCFDDSKCLAQLWQAAGLKTRRGWPYGHSVSEVFYDDAWHMLDGDEHCIFLLRDNRTIASEEQSVRDGDLIKRTHSYGPLQRDDPMTDQGSAALFYYDGPRAGGGWREKSTHTMDFDLRPGEKIVWRWRYDGRYHGFEDIDKWAKATARICNGYLEYSPALDEPDHQKGLVFTELPMEDGARQLVTIPVKSAYPIVGGWVDVVANAPAELREVMILKAGQKEPLSIWKHQQDAAGKPVRVSLDSQFPPAWPACYQYRLMLLLERVNSAKQCPIQPDPLKAFTLHSTLQMAWLAMPALACGNNHVTYADDSESRDVRIEHRWTERSDSSPPPAPAAAEFPADGDAVTGTRFTFEWAPPKSTEPITDYWFELSDRPDMRWPLSPNFQKQIRYTKQAGTASYEVPHEGLLNPGQKYYWRVRARNETGVWGPWSKTWSFTVKAPAPPVELKLAWDDEQRSLTLSWKPNPEGERPARYIIYASDEQGFTASDEPYPVNGGKGRNRAFPANRFAETSATSLVVCRTRFDEHSVLATRPAPLRESDLEADHTNGNGRPGATESAGQLAGHADCMFYRVVAVDADGTRSGPSDYVQAPGPLICTAVPSQIPLGKSTLIQMKALASIGNLRSRALNGQAYQSEFGLNADTLTWSVHSDTHAEIDPVSGLLQIHPAVWDAGPIEVIVICRNQRGQQDVYRFTTEVAP